MSGGGKARTMKRITAALTILGVLLGCTVSLQELREQAPVHAGDFPRPYQALARCVFERMDAQTGQADFFRVRAGLTDLLYRLDDQPEKRRATVSAMTGDVPSAMFEITVEPNAAGGSHVEYRSRQSSGRGTYSSSACSSTGSRPPREWQARAAAACSLRREPLRHGDSCSAAGAGADGGGLPAVSSQSGISACWARSARSIIGSAIALIDRLVHHAEILTIEGDSYRRRVAEIKRKPRPSSEA
jgi:IstB-like ATP binding protein